MNRCDQLGVIANGLTPESPLKERSEPARLLVEIAGISPVYVVHKGADTLPTLTEVDHEVDVVGHQHPGNYSRARFVSLPF
jgi:hypothetical protein